MHDVAPVCGPACPQDGKRRWGKMQHLTISERLLIVALLPALALLIRHAFGPADDVIWTMVFGAVTILSPVLALLVSRSITAQIRRATQAIRGLRGGAARHAAGTPEPRAETARLSAAIGEVPA